jgi:hypothetical protein
MLDYIKQELMDTGEFYLEVTHGRVAKTGAL